MADDYEFEGVKDAVGELQATSFVGIASTDPEQFEAQISELRKLEAGPATQDSAGGISLAGRYGDQITVCQIENPPETIDVTNHPDTYDLILQCRHKKPHRWAMDGTFLG
ncbi:MAG: hypothetical protein ACTS1X_05245 [Parasphingopyxis sp.]|uniref:hypothetical protein n=1 Tax=Parasphingopyxis sp. TaxID=1920299 RepID=UPI003F9EED7F